MRNYSFLTSLQNGPLKKKLTATRNKKERRQIGRLFFTAGVPVPVCVSSDGVPTLSIMDTVGMPHGHTFSPSWKQSPYLSPPLLCTMDAQPALSPGNSGPAGDPPHHGSSAWQEGRPHRH